MLIDSCLCHHQPCACVFCRISCIQIHNGAGFAFVALLERCARSCWAVSRPKFVSGTVMRIRSVVGGWYFAGDSTGFAGL